MARTLFAPGYQVCRLRFAVRCGRLSFNITSCLALSAYPPDTVQQHTHARGPLPDRLTSFQTNHPAPVPAPWPYTPRKPCWSKQPAFRNSPSSGTTDWSSVLVAESGLCRVGVAALRGGIFGRAGLWVGGWVGGDWCGGLLLGCTSGCVELGSTGAGN